MRISADASSPSTSKSMAVVAALLLGLSLVLSACGGMGPPAASPSRSEATLPSGTGDSVLARAFADRASGLEVQGQGTVSRLLRDDAEGAKHQRFIVTMGSGQTVLITHNVDVAPRVPGLRVGDTIAFKGEYEWNAQGGLVHWTHHDPVGKHVAGWLTHEGVTYR